MTPGRRSRTVSRRSALRAFGLGALGLAGAVVLGCDDNPPARSAASSIASPSVEAAPERVAPAPTPLARATEVAGPRAALPAGRIERTLLPGTDWETLAVISHSGRPGPRALILGGVHGNEPGGWLAAEAVADSWEPTAGSLLVVPRANRLSTYEFQRTLPDFGDLNRLYPGDPGHRLPMARMAAAITELARELEVDVVIDMHESWGFYRERAADGSQDGTAFIGQTVTKGAGPLPLTEVARALAAVNERITEREQFTLRDRYFARRRPELPDGVRAPVPEELEDRVRRASSSLSLGGYIPGLTPILVEMGQRDQAEVRRRDLHLEFARELLTNLGVL